MLEVEINSFSYGDKTILSNINLILKPGNHLSILGESGCGKSTLLHLIYGLLHLDNGQISYKGNKLLGPTQKLIPGENFMKLVAQEFNIMPYTTVAENIGAHLSRMNEVKDEARIDSLLDVVDMKLFKNTLVKNLSGGQKQRVALARALANEPEILLLDEPFSNIDTFRKNNLRRNLFKYLKDNNIGCITATHDSEEALAFSDHILMLKQGKVEMFATPEKIYREIANEYQAGFFGEVNVLPKKLFSTEKAHGNFILFPHQLKLSTDNTGFMVRIEANFFKGTHYIVQATWNNKEVFFQNSEKLEIHSVHWINLRNQDFKFHS